MSTVNGQQSTDLDPKKMWEKPVVGCQLSVDLKKRKEKMKKLLVTFAIVMTLGLGANAQSDGFFTSTYGDYNRTESNQSELSQITPKLPGFDSNANESAPVGSGLLLLAGMGLAYAIKRKNN